MRGLNKKIKFVVLVLLIIIIISIAKYLNLSAFLIPGNIRTWVLSFDSLAPLMFMVLYILVTIFFLPGTPITIASGIIFGTALGTVYTVIGATIGATIAFIIAKILGGRFIDDLLKNRYRKLYEYDKKLEKHGILVTILLRVLPIFPFNGLNFALGLTRLRLRDYIIGTLIGIIPGSFVLALFGSSITDFNITNMLLSVLGFALLALIPSFYKRYKNNIKGKTSIT